MGYKSKKYEVGARAFIEQNKGPEDIFEGKWNSSRGGQSGETQIIIRANGQQVIINKAGTVMKIVDSPILPGIGIGAIKLNMTKKELLDLIGTNFKERMRDDSSIIEVENAKFWIAKDHRLDQIGVYGDFSGKYKNCIGIGSTLQDVTTHIGEYIQVYDTFELKNDKGICFELEDIEDWDERTAPIEAIYVFRF